MLSYPILPRFLLLFVLLLTFSEAVSQFRVYQDDQGRVLTTFDSYNAANRSLTASHNQVTVLGSPFLTFPIWQEGKIRLDQQGQELACQLAYNLVTNEVLCRFPDDSTVRIVTPELFTIDGQEFVRKMGIGFQIYSTVLRDGPTKLLTALSKKIGDKRQLDNGYNSYKRDADIQGVYETVANYYIQKGDSKPERIGLTKNAIVSVLYEQAEKIATKLPSKKLTVTDVANALAYYDSLMASTNAHKLPLLADPVFTQTLHDKINYPDYARNQGIYSRVYAGFDIDETGQIRNIKILSPTNTGFRFDVMVKDALEKLPALKPTYKGNYVLPVAFVFTNTTDKSGPQTPVNRLPDDRLEGRTVLDEYIVKAVVSKPPTASKEVWGFYK